ncbi:hypothetical protein ACJX0J_032380, partial [Zea mays]
IFLGGARGYANILYKYIYISNEKISENSQKGIPIPLRVLKKTITYEVTKFTS